MSGERIHEAKLLFILWVGSLSANRFNAWSCFRMIFSLATISSILFTARSVSLVYFDLLTQITNRVTDHDPAFLLEDDPSQTVASCRAQSGL